MKTFKRICLRDHTVTDSEGTSCTIHRGKEYVTSVEKDGKVVVFTNYWVTVPVSLFGGEIPYTT